MNTFDYNSDMSAKTESLPQLPSVNLSELCLSVRKAFGLTQEEMAEWFNVSKSSIEKWEAGKAEPSGNVVARLYEIQKNIRTKSNKSQPLVKPSDIIS